MRAAGALALIASTSACAVRVAFPTPYAAHQLAQDSHRYPARALVHYLSQKGANPEVCDLDAATAHTARINGDVIEALLDALESGVVTPTTWRDCTLRALNPTSAAAVLSPVAERFAELLDKKDATPPVLRALHHVLSRRRPEHKPSARALADLTAVLDDIRSSGRGGLAGDLAADLAQLVEVERGRWRGEAVTATTFAATDDLVLLHRFATWLPDEALRIAARRRIIRLRIAASAFAEVRERPDAVEAEVLARGRNRVALERTRVTRSTAHLPEELVAQGVLVRQDVRRQRAALFARDTGQTTLAPAVDLRGKLLFELVGISRPVTLCGPAVELDPDPCVDAAQLDLDSRAAELNRDGVLHFREDLPLTEAVALLSGAGLLTLRWSWRGDEVARIELPVWFETPADLVLHGDSGRSGPRLQVDIHAVRDWLVITTEDRSEGSRPRRVAVIARDAHGFQVISRGGQGHPGTPGSPGHKGSRGSDGRNATCPSSSGTSGGSGGPGGRGGNGGPGGPGGHGGNVAVEVSCSSACTELAARARLLVLSEGGGGGPGGSGGSGGAGGDGGRGGSGTSCSNYQTGQSTYLSGGSNGSSGPTGPSGSTGSPGAAGRPGKVTIEIER